MNPFALAVMGALTLAGAASADEPKRLQPLNLPVNTADDEDEPHVSSSHLTLYYASNAKGKFDLLMARRTSTGQKWGAGKLVGEYVQTAADDRGVFVTAEGRYPQFLYYATRKDKESKNFDVYVAVKQGPNKVFSAPTPVHATATEADEMHPWLTPDGKSLYFSRKTEEGWRVFVTTRKAATGAQGFGEPTILKDLPPDFHHATLTPDGKTLYLQGPLAKGRWGLFVSTKTNTGWSKPEPLAQLNHPEGKTGDRSPSLSRDGSMLYFASDRPGGKGGLDLWVIPTSQLKKK
jgi:Tol biopolymer transport system component